MRLVKIKKKKYYYCVTIKMIIVPTEFFYESN